MSSGQALLTGAIEGYELIPPDSSYVVPEHPSMLNPACGDLSQRCIEINDCQLRPIEDKHIAEVIQPVWIPNKQPCCHRWKAHCTKDDQIVNKRLSVPQSNSVQIVASAQHDHYQPDCTKEPFCFLTSGWTLDINRDSAVLSVCPEVELVDFIRRANTKFESKLQKLQDLPRQVMKCRIITTLVLCLIIATACGVFWEFLSRAIGICALVYFILRCIYFSRIRSAARKLSEEVHDWIGKHQGPFYERGIVPKVGYYATFISFEATLV